MTGQVLHLEQLWAFVAIDPGDNTEGVISWNDVPLVAGDEAMLGKLRPLAQEIADHLAQDVRLLHFGTRDHVDTLTPGFTCPRCRAVSYNPHDRVEGYCGRCHAFTDAPGDLRLSLAQPS